MPTKKQPKSAASRPVLQWTMAAIGTIVTASAIGVVVWEALQPAAPPALSASIVEVQATSTGQVATIRVANDGDDTAAGVEIEGVIGNRVTSATLDYVPGHGHAEAYLRFDVDPRAAAVRVKGWSKP